MSYLAVIMSIYINDNFQNVKVSINSLLNQSISDFHLYIIFDGKVNSNIEKYFEQLNDSRILIFKRNTNLGLAKSLNELLSIILLKNYNYIARMDADDISISNRLEKQLCFLNSNVDVDCVGSWAIEIDENGIEYFRKQMPISHSGCRKMFMKRDCLIHPTVMFRRSYFEKAGLYPEDTYFGEDTMMWAHGFANGCIFANIPEYLLKFRLDKNFFNRRRGWKHAKSIFKLRRRVNKLLRFPIIADCYAVMYSVAKMMPVKVLNIIYKNLR